MHGIAITGYDELTGAIDWRSETAQPGLPWSGGQVRIEHRTDLQSEDARGWGEPGALWRIQYLPEVQSSIRRPLRALAALPWRIEEPDLPEWASLADKAAHRRHWALCQRVWWGLTRDRKALTKFIREVLVTSAICGFYLGEIVCDEREYDFEGFRARYWMPRLPSYRAPWSLRQWLTLHEVPIGVILDNAYSADYGGTSGEGYVTIPWRKICHISAEQVGSNLEGISWLRPVYNLVKILSATWGVEAAALEINGLGEMIIKLPKSIKTDSQDAAAYRKHIRKRKAAQAPGLVVTEGTEVDVISPQQTVPDYTPFRTGLAKSILLGLDSEDRGMGANETGSYGAKVEAAADQRDGYDYLAQDYIAAAFETVLDRAIAANYPADYAAGRIFCPRAQWGHVEVRDPGAYVDTLATAHVAGLLDHPIIGPVLLELLDVPTESSVGEAGADGAIDEDPVEDSPYGDEKWLLPSEVAERFGFKASTVSGWVKRGDLAGMKVQGRYRVAESAVRALIAKDSDGDGVPDVEEEESEVTS